MKLCLKDDNILETLSKVYLNKEIIVLPIIVLVLQLIINIINRKMIRRKQIIIFNEK